MTQAKTPLMQQYDELKEQAGNALLFFRMGDFYELFHEDAKIAADLLGITLTSRDKNKENPVPMAGVPHHSAQSYISSLLDAGYKVAIGEQIEDPSQTKGIVQRKITQTLTPAIRFELEQDQSPCLATLVPLKDSQSKKDPSAFLLVLFQNNTGCVFYHTISTASEFYEVARHLELQHFLNWAQSTPTDFVSVLRSQTQALIEALPANFLRLERAQELLKQLYELNSLSAFFPKQELIFGLGVILKYFLGSQNQTQIHHLKLPKPLSSNDQLKLGPNAIEHLDLLPNRKDPKPNLFDTLSSQLGKLHTSMGRRALKQGLISPFTKLDQIKTRQALVKSWQTAKIAKGLEPCLKPIHDIDRILSRITSSHATPRDLVALSQSLSTLPKIIDVLKSVSCDENQILVDELKKGWSKIKPFVKKLERELKEDAPFSSKDGKIFQVGTSAELDDLISLTENAEKHLIELEAKERKSTQIPNLKIKMNRVFGYFIEVTKTHLTKVPKHYHRKQSTVNAERFITDELKKLEDQILSAQSKRKQLELHLFQELLNESIAQSKRVGQLSERLATIDLCQLFSQLANHPQWSFPLIDDSKDLEIHQGTHPVVAYQLGGKFVPNTVQMKGAESNTLLITGPNMGGKSTVMRQTALIVILGQLGAPVPAEEARWGVVHTVYTRMGANDAIAQGQSTFMVEMSELAYLLHHANDRSLILLDEIGRGTSTFDGMSMAWASLEWIDTEIKARCLFATHYHELTDLETSLDGLKNVHMAVESKQACGSIRFLYQMVDGKANESFGIQVAQMAGIPSSITQRAWKVLEHLEARDHKKNESLRLPAKTKAKPPTLTPTASPNLSPSSIHKDQLPLFATPPVAEENLSESAQAELQQLQRKQKQIDKILKELKAIDIDRMTPIDALNQLSKWRKKPSLTGSSR